MIRFLFSIISRCVGVAVAIRFVYPLNCIILWPLATLLGINLGDAEKPLKQYRCFQDVFTRFLKPGKRTVHPTATFVSPCDGKLLSASPVQADETISIKNDTYTVADWVQDTHAMQSGLGLLFYLSPKDCHHYVMPQEATITQLTYVPGPLYPVNPKLFRIFPKVFSKNERVILQCEHNEKIWYMVIVAALNVGKIDLPWCEEYSVRVKHGDSFSILLNKTVAKGGYLGCFKMGSSILILYPDLPAGDSITEGPVQIGDLIF